MSLDYNKIVEISINKLAAKTQMEYSKIVRILEKEVNNAAYRGDFQARVKYSGNSHLYIIGRLKQDYPEFLFGYERCGFTDTYIIRCTWGKE